MNRNWKLNPNLVKKIKDSQENLRASTIQLWPTPMIAPNELAKGKKRRDQGQQWNPDLKFIAISTASPAFESTLLNYGEKPIALKELEC